MIPKIIHYCWFGKGEKPKLAVKCIESWKKYCPDYEIIEWNEDNFDINQNKYTRFCYENKLWAYLSDYARLKVVYDNGGIYFDTDVEVLRSFDDLLNTKAFFGFENKEYVNTGVGFGAEQRNKIVKKMLQEYEQVLDGLHGTIGCPILNTEALVKLGLQRNGQKQNIEGAMIYPVDFLNPYDDVTGKLRKTQNTHSVHWFSKSWMSKKDILRSKISKPLHRMQEWRKQKNEQ